MALTVIIILVFGGAIAVPGVWLIVSLVLGKPGALAGVLGTGFGVLLLLVTIIGSALHWGARDDDKPGLDEKDAVVCRVGDVKPKGDNDHDCRPGVWLPEAGRASGCAPLRAKPASGDIPAATYCSTSKPVYSFCERFQVGGVKQPWATWSDLSFVASGLWMLWLFPVFGKRAGDGSVTINARYDNPMTTLGALSIVYCFIIIFMGPPSQWYHASLRSWAGWFDAMSVVAWLLFNAVYVGYALGCSIWDWPRGNARTYWVLGIWGGGVILAGAIAAGVDDKLGLYLASGGSWGLLEAAYLIYGFAGKPQYGRRWWIFAINFGLLAVTMGLWMLFNDSVVKASSCIGREGFPGHALFHILASFATVITFWSFASERKPVAN